MPCGMSIGYHKKVNSAPSRVADLIPKRYSFRRLLYTDEYRTLALLTRSVSEVDKSVASSQTIKTDAAPGGQGVFAEDVIHDFESKTFPVVSHTDRERPILGV